MKKTILLLLLTSIQRLLQHTTTPTRRLQTLSLRATTMRRSTLRMEQIMCQLATELSLSLYSLMVANTHSRSSSQPTVSAILWSVLANFTASKRLYLKPLGRVSNIRLALFFSRLTKSMSFHNIFFIKIIVFLFYLHTFARRK